MAGGERAFEEIPIIYEVRHIPPRRKQAKIDVVCEESVLEVPSWNADEAPVALSLRIKAEPAFDMATHRMVAPRHEFNELDYRIARCADGRVRLVAPIGSPAFDEVRRVVGRGFLHDPAQAHDRELIRFASVPVFRGAMSHLKEPRMDLAAGHPSIGEILSSSRDIAAERAAWLGTRIVSIEGQPWMACPQPGYQVSVDRNELVPGAVTWHDYRPVSFKPGPDPATIPKRGTSDWVPWMPNGAAAVMLAFHRTDPARLLQMGEIREVIPGAMSTDVTWRRLLGCVERSVEFASTNNIYSSSTGLLPSEWALHGALNDAVRRWPDERDLRIARAGLRFTRIVHGIRALGNVEALAEVKALVEELEATQAPPPLDRRLEAAGIHLPHLPNGPGEEPPRVRVP